MDEDIPLRPMRARATARSTPVSDHTNRHAPRDSQNIFESRYPISIALCGLAVSTTLSGLLLAASSRGWTYPSSTYKWIIANRATVQLAVQLLANALALVHVSVLCLLINRATRLHWRRNPVRLDVLRLWTGLCSRTVDWGIPPAMLLIIISYILLTATPSAIWAGALTPVATLSKSNTGFIVPAYTNTSNIREWPSEIQSQGPILRSSKGLFTYAVGTQMQGSLLASGASATTVDGKPRQHAKLDNSRFTYIGRSYGIGASVGLVEDARTSDPYNVAYHFSESGYETSVSCIYNASSEFELEEEDYEGFTFRAYGSLPNSGDAGPEDSVMVGHGTSAIVAIGVGRDSKDPRRILAIAAGKSYKHLDKVQCAADFRPAHFNVSVGLVDRNISVTPTGPIDSSFDHGNLTYVLMRQFELIANDQTNIYVSLVGNSLNSSISNYIIAHENSSAPASLREATLPALENTFEAMIDDMLTAYSSAQLMIQQDSAPAPVEMWTGALRTGDDIYIRAIFGINAAILLLLVVEAARTRVWTQLSMLNYLDVAAVIVATAGASDGAAWQRSGSQGDLKLDGKCGSVVARIISDAQIVLDRRETLGRDGEDTVPLVR